MGSLPSLVMLEACRPTLIFAAIILHQNTILSRQEWKQVPWLAYPQRKDAMQSLVDILADLPYVFYARDLIDLESNPCGASSTRRSLLEIAYGILGDLNKWKQQWIFSWWYTTVPSPPTTPCSVDSEGRLIPLWVTVLQYKSLYYANTLGLHNAALIMILRFIDSLELVTNDEDESASSSQQSIHTAAMEICRSVDYHLDAMRDGAGSLYLLYPLKMASDALAVAEPAIGAWLKDVLERISKGMAGRWAAARHLLEIGAPREAQ